MPDLTLTVNGRPVERSVEARVLLIDFLREHLRLTGTRLGCETAQCGACVVHVDGCAAKACTILAIQCRGAAITTVEGLSAVGGELHPMQSAFREHHGLQCAYCTSGMVMIGLDIARRHGTPDEEIIREDLKGNICRCTGYQHIVDAIAAGSRAMAAQDPECPDA